MNLVVLKGTIAAINPMRKSAEGLSIQGFRLAVRRRRRKDGGETESDFFTCTVFGNSAERLIEYLNVGDPILIHGRIQNNNYTDQNGTKHYADQIMVDSWEFAGRKGDGSANTASSGSGAAPASGSQPAPAVPDTDADGFMNIPDGLDEELPFT